MAFAAAPTVTGISPNNGPEAGGTPVTVTGTGFVSGSKVKLGSNLATSVTVESETKIKATSPQGKGTVDTLVSTSNGTSAVNPNDQFAYDAPPENSWLGLNGNSQTWLGPVSFFFEHDIVYDRIEFFAGELPEKGEPGELLESSIKYGMSPIIPIEYAGYEGNWGTPDPNFPTESNGKLAAYVKGFIETTGTILKLYPGKQLRFEPMNEPWGYTKPSFNAAEYANVIARLLPEAKAAGIPLSDIYVGAIGESCAEKEEKVGCAENAWVKGMYEAQAALRTEIQGWYFHPYGPPSGDGEWDNWGIETVPVVRSTMLSGENNIIISEVGYCAVEVNEGKGCGEKSETSPEAAENSTEMFEHATPYHEAGWLKALLVYSRNDGGWAMQTIPFGGFLTAQGSALTSFADAEKTPAYSSDFGGSGSGEGQFEVAWGVAVDPRTGNVYVSDNKTNRVEEFSSTGTYLTSIGSAGSGNGQLKAPEALAVDSAGDLYVGDGGNHRVEEFNSSHEYIGKFGSEGTGEGQFGDAIGGIAVGSSGDVWASDGANGRVEEFASGGKYLRKVGSEGSGNGEFRDPLGIALDNGDLYVVDHFNHRVQEFSTAGAYISQFGSLGEGKGQFEAPVGIAADPRTGDLYVTDYNADRAEELGPMGVFLAWLGEFGTGSGQFDDPQGIATNSTGGVYVVDFGNHRVQLWDSGGPKWEDVTTGNQAEATASQLSGISCTTGCVAVGSTTKLGAKEALGEYWSGAEWALKSVSGPKGLKTIALTGVSCGSPSACSSVGSYTNSSDVEVTLAEGWNGKEWAVQSTPNPSQAKASVLVGVACPTKACTAVGYSTTKLGVKEPLAEGWEGTKWSQQSAVIPKGAKASALGGVSCTSSSACTAVGAYTNSSGIEVALAEGWNGKEWAVQSAVNSSQAKASVLTSVSCPTKACDAVGSYTNSSKVTEPFAESYSGSEWSLQSVPMPNGAKGGELSSVSCVTASACTAVGSYTNKEGARETLALGWNGMLWSLQSTPNPNKSKGDTLTGVSCVWSTGCYSVGSYTNSSSTLVTLGQKYFG